MRPMTPVVTHIGMAGMRISIMVTCYSEVEGYRKPALNVESSPARCWPRSPVEAVA